MSAASVCFVPINAAFFRVSFLIDAAFEHLRMRDLLVGGIYFNFPFLNAAFIVGWRLKEEIRKYIIQPIKLQHFKHKY